MASPEFAVQERVGLAWWGFSSRKSPWILVGTVQVNVAVASIERMRIVVIVASRILLPVFLFIISLN